MGFLRALWRNAAAYTTRCRPFSAATRHIHITPRAPIPRTLPSIPRDRLGTFCSPTLSFSRGFAKEADPDAEPEPETEPDHDAEEGGGVVEDFDDGADEEISLAYTLSPEELESSNSLLKKFLDSHTRTSPIRLMDEWLKEGNKLTEPVLLKVFRKLRASERASQAHRLMLWVLRENKLPRTEKVYLMAIMGAQKARRVSTARKIYDEIPLGERTTGISTAMMEAYAKDLDTKSAESILVTFTPKTAQAFNVLINMYVRLEEFVKAKEVYERMRKAGMRPNKGSFLTLAKHKKELGIEIDKTEAEAILEESIDDLENNKRALYAAKNTMLAYAYMGDGEGVEKIWSRLEKVEVLPTYFWAMGVEAFGCVARVDKLEELVEKVSESRRREETFYPAVLRAYVRNNEMDKAESVVGRIREGAEETKLTYRLYDELIRGYLERKEWQKALEKMKEARESITVRRTRPSFYTVRMLLPLYSKVKDVESAEELVKLTARVEPLIYHQLLKVYIAARKKPEYDFLERMRKAKIKPVEETKKLLKKAQEYAELVPVN